MKTLPVVGVMKGSPAEKELIAQEAREKLLFTSKSGKALDSSYGETKDEYKATKNDWLCTCSQLKKKLITKEDPIYLHKTLGLFALCHFLYRYAYVLPKYGNLGFNGTWFDHFSIFMHLALSCSSIIFEVIAQRIFNKPLIIYEEYRLHTMIFTLKATSIYVWGIFAQPYFGDTRQSRLLQFVFL